MVTRRVTIKRFALACFFKSEALAYCSLKSSILTPYAQPSCAYCSLKSNILTSLSFIVKKKTITKYKNVNSIFFVKKYWLRKGKYHELVRGLYLRSLACFSKSIKKICCALRHKLAFKILAGF